MMLFTFLAMFLLLAAICFTLRNKSLISVVFTGIIAAVLVCAFRTFFLFAHRVVPYSFGENFLYLFLRQSLFPLLILSGLFYLLSRDALEYKVEMLLPLLTSFYAIYLPYCITSSAEGLYSAYALFLKPMMFAAMLLQLDFSIKEIRCSIAAKKSLFLVIYIISALLFITVPALVEAMYLINTNFIITLLCCIPYCAITLCLRFLKLYRAK